MQRVNLPQRSELLAESLRLFAEATTDLKVLVPLVLERCSKLSGGLCLLRFFEESSEAPSLYHPDPEELRRCLSFVEPLANHLDKSYWQSPQEASLLALPTIPSHFVMPGGFRSKSALLLPLTARGRARGYLALINECAPCEEDASFFRELSHSAALCLDTAFLFATERSARRQAESELEERKYLETRRFSQSAESTARMTGRACHDLNNQISIILACSSLLASELLPNNPTKEDVLEISRAAERAATLTKQLFIFSHQQLKEAQSSDTHEAVHHKESRS